MTLTFSKKINNSKLILNNYLMIDNLRIFEEKYEKIKEDFTKIKVELLENI
jgi:hypothetical protein